MWYKTKNPAKTHVWRDFSLIATWNDTLKAVHLQNIYQGLVLLHSCFYLIFKQ